MKKHINHYWLALALLLPALHACTDDNEAMPGDRPGTAGTPTVVRASVGNEPDTRAQVTYGTNDPKEGEYFMWNTGDKFTAYNITAVEATPTAYTFNIDGSYDEAQPSNQADFSCTNFSAAAGNKVAAFYGNISYGNVASVTDPTHGKGIQAELTRPSVFQSQTDTPGNADLKPLRGQLCMYAIGQADGSGSVSPLSFRHLSALFRITIRNQKSDEAKIDYTSISFPKNEKIVCDKKKVTVWEDNTVEYEVAESEKRYFAGNYLTNANGDNFATIAPGSSYDCFLAAMPVAEGKTASSITTEIRFNGQTELKSVTIDGFTNVEIKAGMRYWFDLTVKADGTLVQTSMLPNYAWYTQDNNATEYSLSTPGELRALANLVNGTEEALSAASASGPVSFEGKTIRLARDIDLGNEAWTPIGNDQKSFKGTFDGGGRHISGLNVDNGSNPYTGLFSRVEGKVSNLRVSGKVKTTGAQAGGIAGTLVSGSTVENCIFNGDVSGASFVGGIAGWNYGGTIAGCYTKGSVEATNAGGGGIAGKNAGTITTCYSEATVTGSGGGIAGSSGLGNSISHCYATGSVSGIWNIGGIIGAHGNGTVKNCIALNLALTRTSGSDTEFGRIAGGLSTDPMNPSSVTSCAAFQGMTIKDANGSFYADATGKHGDPLSAAQCLTATTYTTLGFAEPTTGTPGWAFDTATRWTYLPWNPVFESFPGISAADYRISVPPHLNGNGTVN